MILLYFVSSEAFTVGVGVAAGVAAVGVAAGVAAVGVADRVDQFQ